MAPAWAAFFESLDPAVTRQPIDVRHPFFDVRVVAVALRLPSFPWCVSKTVLRLAMQTRLPETIRSRPKTPLALSRDPFGELETSALAARALATWLKYSGAAPRESVHERYA